MIGYSKAQHSTDSIYRLYGESEQNSNASKNNKKKKAKFND